MLQIAALTKRFGDVRAVDAASIDVPGGEMLGIIGRSGAGKSTLLRMINRLNDPTAGRIVFDGVDVTALKGAELRRWRARCAMIFQQFNLVGRLDVVTNVLLGRLNGQSFASSMLARFDVDQRADAVRALDRLDMAQTALQRADTLSGGQQQRVAIARALMQRPDVVLADEPIASLDPRNATIVMDALRRINREDGITVISNLHTLDTARAYCDRVIGMLNGRIVFDGPPAALDEATIKRIYGVEADEQLSESVTSTALSAAC